MPDGSSLTETATTPANPRRSTGIALWSVRIAASLHLAALLLQAISAGGLLGDSMAASAHGTGSTFVHLFGLLQLIAAVLYWRPGHGAGWFAWASLLLFVGGVLQSMVGGSGAVEIHVPLGMALAVVTTAVVIAAWAARRSTEQAPPSA